MIFKPTHEAIPGKSRGKFEAILAIAFFARQVFSHRFSEFDLPAAPWALLKRFFIFLFFVMNIFVAKLSYDTQEDTLRAAFEEFGEVSSAKIIMDKYEGRSKGFGFVEMPNDDEAMEAINELNDSELDGRYIVVKKARPREDNRGGGGYNRRGGGGWGNDRRY